jgi:hypothetical protein
MQAMAEAGLGEGVAKGQDPANAFSLAEAMGWLQERLQLELAKGRAFLPHVDEVGDNAELHWLDMLRVFLPERYSVDTAFVVDVNGRASGQIDVLIYDTHYSPLIFQRDTTLYVPAESVYAVFEVKQNFTKGYVEYAGDKVASVRSLERTSAPIRHAGGTYAPKEHLPIIGGLLALTSDWAEPFGQSFVEAVTGLDDQHRLDLGCAAANGAFEMNPEGTVREVWPNDHGALVWFVTRLFARLQQVGTVPAIDIVRWADQALGTPAEG